MGPTAYQFSKTLQELLYEARESLEKVSRRIKKYADKGTRPPKYRVGDRVMLKLIPYIWKKIKSRQYQKSLIPKYDGPFEIVKKIGAITYKLKLLERL